MYDIKNFKATISYGFKEDSLKAYLEKMFIATEEEKAKHQSLEGVGRYPQDIPDSMFGDIWKKNEPHITIRGKLKKQMSDWTDTKVLAERIMRNNNVKPNEMYAIKFEYEKDPNTQEAEKEWSEFVCEIKDFLDYIVKAITNDTTTGIKIDMVSYAEHAHLNQANLEFLVLFRLENKITVNGQELIAHDRDLFKDLFEMFHEYLESISKPNQG